MGGAQIFVDGIQVGVVSQKHLVGGSVLQHLGNRSQVSALFGGQLTPSRYLDDVEGIGRHDGWVHVAVIQQVAHDLQGQPTSVISQSGVFHRLEASPGREHEKEAVTGGFTLLLLPKTAVGNSARGRERESEAHFERGGGNPDPDRCCSRSERTAEDKKTARTWKQN